MTVVTTAAAVSATNPFRRKSFTILPSDKQNSAKYILVVEFHGKMIRADVPKKGIRFIVKNYRQLLCTGWVMFFRHN
jgi:hypothetical protein